MVTSKISECHTKSEQVANVRLDPQPSHRTSPVDQKVNRHSTYVEYQGFAINRMDTGTNRLST